MVEFRHVSNNRYLLVVGAVYNITYIYTLLDGQPFNSYHWISDESVFGRDHRMSQIQAR